MQTNDMQMESSKCEEQPKSIMEAETELKNENLDDQQQEKLNKSNGLEVAIMLPPPPVLVNLIATLGGGDSSSRPLSSLAAATNGNGTDKNEEEEVLSLQVLSARSSTPYTVQGICCANANCAALEATTDSSNASQWKEENHTQLVTEVIKEDDDHHVDENGNIEKQHNLMNGHSDERKKYSRSDLLDIRDEMTIIRPECLESARLQRLHFRKSENGSFNGSGIGRNKSYRNSNPPNDLMPAFFKRKAVTSNGNNSNSMYDNFKYNDSNPFSNNSDSGSFTSSNYRRIGSGRISSVRETNWDYIPEEDPDRHNLPEFFNTKDSIGTIQPKPQRPHRKHELDDNSNYVKRVISAVNGNGGGESFRLSGSRHSINSSGEERYNSTASSSNNNKSDEPEWFSCGPTSRLDTIELCGFNESDQQKIRMEMSKNKPDSNNNRHDFTHGQQHNNKEKKHLAFQFDDFSSSHNNKPSGNGSGAHVGPKMPSSKFMPLFNAKKKDEEAMTNHTSTQLLNEIFKRNDIPAANTTATQKEKLSTTEMPSVDEIEAKWRTNIPNNNDSRGKQPPSSENFNNSSENFKKMLHQLNQQQQQHGAGGNGSMSSPPPQQVHSQSNNTNNNNNQQPPMNLFNNENLSNFIKHRSLQQQILQKQQQQAAFAQLQFNAILSRPDTQMLLLSLARGEISKHGLVVQLANPNLTQADREAISAALTFSAAGQYHHQMAINSNQQQFIANQLQNLALMTQMNKSPVSRRNANGRSNSGGGGGNSYQSNNGSVGGSGNGNGSPRTYTQEELQSHANFILHNAMLKKKLEEQNMGLQKMLHLQSSMMNGGGGGNINNNARNGGNDSMAGTKNFHNHNNYHQQQKAPHQQQNIHHQQQQQQHHHQQSQRPRRGSNAGNRSNHPLGRRRSTSSSSTNTVNSGNMPVNSSQHNANMHLRRQLEQRRNTIATTTVGADDFVQIPQRI